jgi:hypothetical protein
MAKFHVLKDIRLMLNGTPVKYKAGRDVELPDNVAKMYLQQGAVERYATKVIRQDPLVVAGSDTPSSALPAVEVSQTETLPKPKRGRKKAVKEQ